MSRFDRENCEIALRILSQGKARTFEVRVPKARNFKTISGYFTNVVELVDALEQLSNQGYEGVYYTLNPVNPALLARANNTYKNWAEKTSQDGDVINRDWMLIDIDPDRPSGISSSNDEKKAAKALAKEVRDWLTSEGWPQPVVCDSGNGYHLLYRIDEPAGDLSRDLIKDCLAALAAKFDTPAVKVDKSVYNASRIVKAYGTVARKGDETDDRPHRTARMLTPPDKLIEVVKIEQILKLSDLKPGAKKAEKKTIAADGPWTVEKLEKMFEATGWEHEDPVPFKGAQKYVGICPRNSNHAGFAVFLENGWVNVECFHKKNCDDFKTPEQFLECFEGVEFELPTKVALNMDFLGVQNADEEIEEAKVQAQQTAGLTEPFNLTDIGNMERLVWRHGSKLKYAAALKWLVWDGTRWREDNTGKAQRLAWNTVRLIREEAKLIELPPLNEDGTKSDERKEAEAARGKIYAWGETSEMGGHISLMLKHTQSAMGVAATSEEFDQDLNLLNTKTGTIDLITGEVRPHDREDMLTKIAPVEYDPNAKCPLWEKFMLEVFGGNQTMVDFVQRALGYSLTGETIEHKLFIMWGNGSNGKSTMLETVRHTLGGYAQAAEFTTFIAKKDAKTAASPEVASMRGARFVSATEGEKTHKLGESFIKQCTGGDTLRARHLFCEPFDFVPQMKIWLGTNHKPEISGTDDGIWRRVCLIPFTVSFLDNPDLQLKEKLKREAPGILAWMVRGLVEWRKHGLMEPDEVKAATAAYRADEDLIVRFVDDECEVAKGNTARAGELYDRYKRWAANNHEEELSERKFADEMKAHAYEKKATKVGRVYQGIKLVESVQVAMFVNQEEL